MNAKTKVFLYFVIGACLGMGLMYLFNNYSVQKKENTQSKSSVENISTKNNSSENVTSQSIDGKSIDELTNEEVVTNYVKNNHRLPDYYITKSDARNQGWIASKGNLCEVLPGKAIGGDRFGNREKQLPKGEQYYEADVNYHCGNRGADRIVFTKNGTVYLTKNHYQSFEKQ